jgi:ribosomal-protein-serine acetyltransferase
MLVQALPLKSVSGISIIPVAVEHATALASLVQQNIEHLQGYLPAVANLSSVEAAGDHLCFAVAHASKAEIFEWHLFVEGTLCGSVRLKDIDRSDRKAKIGYFIGQQFTGKGIVSSAVFTVLEFCFGPLNLNRIELRCASRNEPSKRVAERLGFVHEGILRQEQCLNGVFVDQHIYGLLATDFEARQRPLWVGNCRISMSDELAKMGQPKR